MPDEKSKKLKTHTIDCEPKWVNLVPLYCEWLEDGVESQKKIAREDILKMAKLSDIVRQAQKQAKKDGKKEVTITFEVD